MTVIFKIPPRASLESSLQPQKRESQTGNTSNTVGDNFWCEVGQVGESPMVTVRQEGETVSDRKNNKRTMKGSKSDLTVIACS